RFCCEPACEGDFLLVAAGEGRGGGIDGRSFDCESTDKIFGEGTFGIKAQPCAGKNLRMNTHRDVCGDRHFEDDTVSAAVFGDVSDAMFDGITGSADLDALPIYQDFAGMSGGDTKENAGEFSSARANQAGEAKDFAGAKVEGNVCDVGWAAG